MDDVRAAFFAIGVLAAALTYMVVAKLVEPASHPHGCVRPTAMPATWFGDCAPPHQVRR